MRRLSQTCYKVEIPATLAAPPRPGTSPSGSRRRRRARIWPVGRPVLSCPTSAKKSMPSVPARPAEPGLGGRASDPLIVVRYLDVVVLVLAAPFIVLLGAPVLGYAVATAAWILQRFAASAIERFAARQEDYRRSLGLNMA